MILINLTQLLLNGMKFYHYINPIQKEIKMMILEQVQNRAILLTYINYNLLFTTLKRDLLLIGQLAKIDNKDIIRLFNGILVIVQNLKDLPGFIMMKIYMIH